MREKLNVIIKYVRRNAIPRFEVQTSAEKKSQKYACEEEQLRTSQA